MTPSRATATAARRALDVRAEKPASQRGMTPIGIRRATQLANRQTVSLDTAKRMVSYFTRHLVDKKGSTWGEQGKGWQAWMGWGGDPGARQAIALVRQEDREWFDRWRQGVRAQALLRHLGR